MRTLTVRRTVVVPAPGTAALAVVRDVATLEYCEPKIDALALQSNGAAGGAFWAHGRVLGKRWSGEFSYRLHDNGFDSAETLPSRSGLNARGGFHVEAMGERRCRITHYEQYTLPLWALPLRRALAWYVGRSIDCELENLARLIAECAGVSAAA